MPHQHERETAAESKRDGALAAEMAPEEIRAIRKHLGLSQAEAGELLGGGPRAFTKYEAGAVKPAAAVVTLLHLLERDPTTIRRLQAIKSLPMTPMPEAASPFQITGEHIARLNERLFNQFLRRLLYAEAQAHNLPTDGIHVSDNINAPDGGEDGRIEWQDGPARTPSLPSRVNQFQLKSGQITPAKAGGDILQNGKVKPMVRHVLETGGHYRMLCAHSYTKKAIESRERSIREAIRNAGVAVKDSQIAFWDADQIAAWTNQHPSVAIWVKEQTQPGTIGPFRSWTHWAGHPDHDNSPRVEDERLPPLRGRLRTAATTSQGTLRLVGLAGIGKSRLALEALGPPDDNLSLSDMVLYADESVADTNAIVDVVQTLADTGSRSVVVVNRCCPQTHRILVGMVSRSSSRLSLLTLDDDIPRGTLDKTMIRVNEASPAVVEAIIDQTLPNLPSEDRRRLVHLSEGFPRIAIDIARAWNQSIPIAHAQDDDIVNAFVWGRQPREPERTLKSAMLVAAFGVVTVEPDDSQLKEVASFRHDLTVDDLRICIGWLVERGIVRRKGRLRVLQPRPIAMRLAERQWREWSPSQRDRILAGGASPKLSITAARVLAQLNTTSIAEEEVVRHVCRPDGPLAGYAALARPGQAEVLSILAEVAPDVILKTMERALNEVGDLSKVAGNVRRHIVRALEKIVFPPATFDGGARLLLRLANATDLFRGIFHTYLGNTAADGDARLALLDEILDTAEPEKQWPVVEALVAGLETRVLRTVGAETHGSRPALSPWLPPSRDAEVRYVVGCVSRLTTIAAQNGLEPLAARARKELGQHLRSLVRRGYMDAVEQAVRRVAPVASNWPAAVESLGHVLEYDAASCSSEDVERVRKLLADLLPESLESRIHFLVTAMPWDYPLGEQLDFDERARRQEESLKKLAVELAQTPDILDRALPELSCGDQRKADIFGEGLGQLADLNSTEIWLERIVQAAVDAPDSDRNLGLLIGFCVGVAKSHQKMAEPIKERLTQSSALAPAFPSVCARLGIEPSDIKLAVDALREGPLPPSQLAPWRLDVAWSLLPPLAVTPLFDALLEHVAKDAFATALNLISTYCMGNSQALDSLRPQIRKCVEKCAAEGKVPRNTMSAYRFELLAMQMLGKGREDADACTIALDLTKIMVESSQRIEGQLPNSIVQRLLSDFPEIVWPRVGAAITADDGQDWLLAHILGTDGLCKDDSLILSLPKAVLFSWCHAHPDKAPAFAARVVPVLAEGQDSEKTMHPLLRQLIDEFGEYTNVLDGIEDNINNFAWVGSLTGYYEQYIKPLSALADHKIPTVRLWAKRLVRRLEAGIEHAREEDAEQDARREI